MVVVVQAIRVMSAILALGDAVKTKVNRMFELALIATIAGLCFLPRSEKPALSPDEIIDRLQDSDL